MKAEMSVRERRKQKFLLVLPLLILPFLTLAFYAAGGGNDKEEALSVVHEGLNEQLPQPVERLTAPEDKMSFYDQADKDSIAAAEMMRSDPYYQNRLDQLSTTGQVYPDQNERQVMEKIRAISQAVSAPPVPKQNEFAQLISENQDAIKPQTDPEMEAINQTIERILDVQHPERVREKIREQSMRAKGQVFTVHAANTGGGFYGLSDADSGSVIAIPAVVHEEQSLVSGATVKMRLTRDVFIRGVQIPQGSFVYGIASMNGERLRIQVENILYKDDLYPVSLSVYDADGIEGIKIPGSVNRESAKETAEHSAQSFQLFSPDASLKAQAATAGVNAAKGLFAKKAKLVRVTVKAGHRILLKDQNQNL